MQEADGRPPDPPDAYGFIPSTEPTVSITRSSEAVSSVECRELQWWFVIPEVGCRSIFAKYDLETEALHMVVEVKGIEAARIHDLDCVKLHVCQYRHDGRWSMEKDVWYARVDRRRTEWLAVERQNGAEPRLLTYLDPGFADDWGDCSDHILVDEGRFKRQADGSYTQIAGRSGIGAGTYDVTIGRQAFHCFRVIDPGRDEHDDAGEAYIDSDAGRTVLYRQYRGRLMKYDADQDPLQRFPADRFPQSRRLVVDGNLFVQCDCTGRAHDTITDFGLGLTQTAGADRR